MFFLIALAYLIWALPAAGDVHRSKAMRLIDMKYILSLGDDGSACRLKAIYSSGSGFCACLCLREIVMEVSVSAMQFAYSRLQCKLIIWPQVTRGLDPSVRWHDLVLMLRMHCDALGWYTQACATRMSSKLNKTSVQRSSMQAVRKVGSPTWCLLGLGCQNTRKLHSITDLAGVV
jgi:hypothetical protein